MDQVLREPLRGLGAHQKGSAAASPHWDRIKFKFCGMQTFFENNLVLWVESGRQVWQGECTDVRVVFLHEQVIMKESTVVFTKWSLHGDWHVSGTPLKARSFWRHGNITILSIFVEIIMIIINAFLERWIPLWATNLSTCSINWADSIFS